MEWNDNWVWKKGLWEENAPDKPLKSAEKINLPHTWYNDGDYYRGEGVYQKKFFLEKRNEDHVFVRFDGVDQFSKIYLNGSYLGEHRGGYSSFAVDLTNALNTDGTENTLTVFVTNEKNSIINPLSGDFTIFGGIHRGVNLIIKGETYFDCGYYGTCGVIFETKTELKTDVKHTVEAECGYVFADPYIAGEKYSNLKIKYIITDQKGETVLEQTEGTGRAKIKLLNPHLWDGKKDPYLYSVKAILYRSDRKMDEVEQTIGFRVFETDSEKGSSLNGKRIKLQGVAKHQDTAKVFSAATKENWEKDFELIDEIGANAVRLSHYQHPAQVYDLCDEKGLLTWAEIPLLKLTEDEDLLKNAKEQLMELILQNKHHPSIVMWGLQNEIAIFEEKPYMYEKMKELQEFAKDLDSRRYTTSANLNSVEIESKLNQITDLQAYNWYYGWYYGDFNDYALKIEEFHKQYPDKPLAVSEYGADANTIYHSDTPKAGDYTEEFQALYHEKVYPILISKDYVFGTFVWNMFDFISPIRIEGGLKYRNQKGLVTHDRKTRKDAFYYYKAQWQKEPFVWICGKRFKNRSSEKIQIKVYSNQKSVCLSFGNEHVLQRSETGVFVFADIDLSEGENLIKAVGRNTDDMSVEVYDEATFVRVNEPDESYIYVDNSGRVNVKNWYEDEVGKEAIFPKGYYSVIDTMGELLKSDEVAKMLEENMPKVLEFMKDSPGSFTLEQGISHDKLCTEEETKKLNKMLTTIHKQENE